ncbi:MAG: AmmeMemoRadiSam system protein B [Candidatus Lokiarchaeota archaeon]|nr:AmmeMemoRadiSam system protein B [Candidatus Lokiarchaeota archaeon]
MIIIQRKATHAGSWYSGKESIILKEMEHLFSDSEFGPGQQPFSENLEIRSIIGGVSPHAGYRFSGYCAAHTYLNLFREKIPDTIIILGTIHNPCRYENVAIFKKGVWETPLGNLIVDEELANKILDNCDLIKADNEAFTGICESEHNIEIQLPFIKYCAKDSNVKIVPIKLGYTSFHNYDLCEEIANGLAKSIKSYDKDVVIVASSDMQHNTVLDSKKLEKFKSKDQKVIDAFKELEGRKLMDIVKDLSVCGPQTITTLVLTCKKLEAKKGEQLKHYTSVDKEGFGYCVGYFSGIIVK